MLVEYGGYKNLEIIIYFIDYWNLQQYIYKNWYFDNEMFLNYNLKVTKKNNMFDDLKFINKWFSYS